MKTKSKIDKIFKVSVLSFLIFYMCIMFFLLAWGLMTSFKYIDDYVYNGVLTFPKKLATNPDAFGEALRFGNYKRILADFSCSAVSSYSTIWGSSVEIKVTNLGIFGLLLNTLYLAIFCNFVQVFINYLVAYLAAKYKFKFSGFLYFWVIITMTIPTIGTAPAMVDLLQKLGLYGRHIGMLAMRASYGGVYFLVFYAMFEGLPDSFVEAAEMDGASQLNILFTIIIPMGIKMIATVTLIMFVANWNDYSVSFLYMPTVPTLALAIYELAHVGYAHSDLTGNTYKVAGCMILAIPITVIFIIFRDKIMGNISAGGLKG